MTDRRLACTQLDAVRLQGSGAEPISCAVADETPVALAYNGFPHAVLMATPRDLEDLAVGFSLTDGICKPSDISGLAIAAESDTISVNIELRPGALAKFLGRRQAAVPRSFTSCGLCGIERPDLLPKPAATTPSVIDPVAIRAALAALRDHQPLNRATGAAHAAAWATPAGNILLAREDVGRHNALDKLIGALVRDGAIPPGFCVLTSRCSFEMVQKASVAGMGLVVCVSAPTSRAIAEARAAGLALVALARADSQIVYVTG